MKEIGIVLALIGVGLCAYFFVFYNVGVETPFGEVANLHRMNTRTLGCVGGIVLAAVGVIVAVVAHLKEPKKPSIW